MKILLANKFYYPRGGDCIHTMQLQQLLEKNGHEVAIFSMQHEANNHNSFDKYWPSEVSFTQKSVSNAVKTILRPFGTGEVKSKWLSLLWNFQPDVVHLHNIHSQLSPVIAQLAKEQKIPVFWTLHDYKLLCPASAFLDNENNVCDLCLQSSLSVVKKRCIKGSFAASVVGYLEGKTWAKNNLERYVNAFIAPSLFMKQKMKEGGFSDNKIIQLCNFTDSKKFDVEVDCNRTKNLLYVGRISIEKGVETLCKAVSELGDVKLKIIGDGPLKQRLSEMYASDNIQFLGFQSWEYIAKELSRAAFLVIPSQWFENNPLTVIEAFALGTPVLGADIGGIPELIIQNENGMVFEPGNVGELIEKIKLMLLFNMWDYKAIRDNAKHQFDEQQYYNKIIEIYNI